MRPTLALLLILAAFALVGALDPPAEEATAQLVAERDAQALAIYLAATRGAP